MKFPGKEWGGALLGVQKGRRRGLELHEESVLHSSHICSSIVINTKARGWVGKADRRKSFFYPFDRCRVKILYGKEGCRWRGGAEQEIGWN